IRVRERQPGRLRCLPGVPISQECGLCVRALRMVLLILRRGHRDSPALLPTQPLLPEERL
ncbi:MAG TPA: hypothetical protein PKJ93_05260, partial [Methanoculleus sp.]|nr:hypothetical protein [Methanoculleus sp.]